jgi:hypothetical protein
MTGMSVGTPGVCLEALEAPRLSYSRRGSGRGGTRRRPSAYRPILLCLLRTLASETMLVEQSRIQDYAAHAMAFSGDTADALCVRCRARHVAGQPVFVLPLVPLQTRLRVAISDGMEMNLHSTRVPHTCDVRG